MSAEPDTKPSSNGADSALLARMLTAASSDLPVHTLAVESWLRNRPVPRPSPRIVVSGPPGVGKSTLIGSLGTQAADAGRRVAVLATDPSSPVNSGAVLGDRLRMSAISELPHTFVRQLSDHDGPGGLSPGIYEAITLCESVGYDLVIVEAVGGGQSNNVATALGDVCLTVLAPGLGDEVQGMKRGSLELADFIAVNKADGDQRKEALTTLRAVRIARSARNDHAAAARCVAVSGAAGEGVNELYEAMISFFAELTTTGQLLPRRSSGLRQWVEARYAAALARQLLARSDVQAELASLVSRVERQQTTVTAGLSHLPQPLAEEGKTR